jgi:hypothetical protein
MNLPLSARRALLEKMLTTRGPRTRFASPRSFLSGQRRLSGPPANQI